MSLENLPSEKNQTKQHSHILQVYDPDLDLLSKFGARYALKPGGQIKLGWHSDATRAWSMTKKQKSGWSPHSNRLQLHHIHHPNGKVLPHVSKNFIQLSKIR